MKRVVVVGGGYAGVALARTLDEVLDVVLVERGDRFFHNVGAMRAYAEPALWPKLLIPYDRLLRRGCVRQGEMARAEGGGVTLGNGDRIEADAVVVATGLGHVAPFKNPLREGEAFLREARGLSERLAGAARVAIVGDGPVAVELAGEVSWKHPAKRLTVVTRGESVLGGGRLGERSMAALRRRGVAFARESEPGALVIRAYGEGGSRRAVDGHLRADGVWWIGDAADCGEPALVTFARRQAEYVAGLLRRVLGEGAAMDSLPVYRPARRVAMSIPLGPQEGFTQLPLPGAPVVGGWLTSRVKGRDLFVARNWERLGWETGKTI